MSEATFTFRVDSTLKRQFTAEARKRDRVGSQVLRDFMRQYVAEPAGKAVAPTYDEWFRSQVQAALNDRRAPVASATVEQHFARRRTAARRK
jgi:hypothetical protein